MEINHIRLIGNIAEDVDIVVSSKDNQLETNLQANRLQTDHR
jgi:hypothetical protein